MSESMAEYFDQWYADMAVSSAKDEIVQRHLGLPPHLLSTSLLGWDGIADVTEALALVPGRKLLDLACGRGGYGLEIAERTGAHLIGVDFSAEAIRQAEEQARRLGREATFRVGDLTASGLEPGSVHGVLCIDAIQFAEPPSAAYAEIRRVLMAGGRAVLTGWEPVDPGDAELPERLRRADLGAGLADAGFERVEVHERADWQGLELAMWQDAVALDPGSDAALAAFHDEGVRVLEFAGRIRRVLATAR